MSLRKLLSITLLCLTLTLSPKSLATEICFQRSEIELYKTKCEVDRARSRFNQTALDLALKHEDISFYQESSFVIGHSILTALLLVLVAK